MARFFFVAMAAGAAAMAACGQASATEQPSQAALAPRLMPFDPPLDRPLRYRLTTEHVRDGRTIRTTTDFSVTFGRGAEGLTLRVDYVLPGNIAPGSPTAILLRPITFQLDQYGQLAGIADEPAYWAEAGPALDELMRTPGRSASDEALVARIRGLRTLPQRERAELLAVRVGRIIDYANRNVQAEFNSQSTLRGQIYDQRMQRDDGTIRITTQASPRAQSGFRMHSQEIYLISTRTGLTSRWEERRLAEGGGQEGGVQRRQTHRILELLP